MILEAIIVTLTKELNTLYPNKANKISSNNELKEKALTCMLTLIKNAPVIEYKKFIDSENYDIFLGSVLEILCRIAKDEKAKHIKQLALDIILCLINHLESFHKSSKAGDKCCILSIISGLPGVVCALLRIIMKDTKLPKQLLCVAIKALTKYITTAFLNCPHKIYEIGFGKLAKLEGDDLKDFCDNFSPRLRFLLDYVTNHNSDLADEVKYEVLCLCHSLVCETREELLNTVLISIIKYTASFTPTDGSDGTLKNEAQVKILLIFEALRQKLQVSADKENDRFNEVVLSCLFSLLDNLNDHCLTMLISERESELSVLCGLLKLLPETNLTTFLEMTEKRIKFINIVTQLSEFNTSQPFLFLTDGEIDEKAIETCSRIYTVQKRFLHANEKELGLVETCCSFIGQNCEWFLFEDIFKCDMRLFSSTSNLYITHLMLKGCLNRTKISQNPSRFTKQSIEFYIDQAQENYTSYSEELKGEGVISSQQILKIVIAIETIVTLIKLHVKFVESESQRIIILRTILCPLLNWVSSKSRAISEAALSGLAEISTLYGHNSTKALIESNIDYIVDGVMELLNNFMLNDEVTNVLAFTFKLSSIDCFYYFRDVYDRILTISASYYYTEKSKSFAMLFYRTLSIISDWKEATDVKSNEMPLENESSVNAIISDLSLEKRLKKLQRDLDDMTRMKEELHSMKDSPQDHDKVLEELKSGKLPEELGLEKEDNTVEERVKKKPPEIELTEKILLHCVNFISANHVDTRILALKAASCGFKVLRDEEDTLLPLVHKVWSPLMRRLTENYKENIEVSLCAFECLLAMAFYSKDFIQRRTLDSIIPKICLFLEVQSSESEGKKNYGPYSMTIAYKCQLRILTQLGALAHHIQLAYSSLWRIVKVALIYLNESQIPALRAAARESLYYLIASDADCVWYYAKETGHLDELPFKLIFLFPDEETQQSKSEHSPM